MCRVADMVRKASEQQNKVLKNVVGLSNNESRSILEQYTVDVFFYYSGHGTLDQLIPVDGFDTSNKVSKIKEKISDAIAKNNILIIEACRTNYTEEIYDKPIGLKEDFFIVYSTQPTESARASGSESENNIFTSALLKTMDNPDLSIEDIVTKVTKKMSLQGGNIQLPYRESTLSKPIYLLKRRKSMVSGSL
jgi:hypothetical protein